MHAGVSTFTSAVLVVLALSAAGCDDNGNGGPVQASMNGPSPFQSRLVSVEPAALIPEFRSDAPCRALPPFQTRFNLVVPAARNLFLRRLGFAFVDRAGGRTLPKAIPTSLASVTASSSMPVPFPTSHAVPIPGSLPFHGAMISPPSGTLGLLLNFDCGIPARGTLFIDIETAGDDGVADVSHISVRVG